MANVLVYCEEDVKVLRSQDQAVISVRYGGSVWESN